MNGYRKMMMAKGGNLSWCCPYESVNERVKFTVNEGNVCGLLIDGKNTEITLANLETAAKIANTDYPDYVGYDAKHILIDASHEGNCSGCPWFLDCDAMDNPVNWDSEEYTDDED